MKRFIFFLSVMLCTSWQLMAQRSTLISNVTIVDVENGQLKPQQWVMIKKGSITRIGGAEEGLTWKADKVIDGSGRFLMPGLWDMHAHIWNDATTFPLLVANGVTGVRGMFEDMNNVKRWRESIASGKIAGPRLMVAGPIVDGPKPVWPGSVAVKNETDGRRAVDSLKNQLKVDFIKVYSLLSPDSYLAIADESRKQNIPFAGHVPNEVTALEAARAGQKSQEHLYGLIEIASDSSDHWFKLVKGTIKDSSLNTRARRKEFLFRTYNETRLKQVLLEMKETGTYICPTLTVNRGIAYVNDTSLLHDPRMVYMGNFIRNFWDYRKDFRFKSWTPADFQYSRREFELKLKITRLIHEAGIPILAGTDFPNPHCYAGFGIHDEMALLVKAGLSNAAAIQAATINPARYFNLSATEGSVAENKTANLILLSQNPLQNISHTQSIEMVLLQGRVYSAADLQQMLESVKKMVATRQPAVAPMGMHVHED